MIEFKLISITYKCLPDLISACLYSCVFCYSSMFQYKFCVHYNHASCLKFGISILSTGNVIPCLTWGNWNLLIQSNFSWPTTTSRLLETPLLYIYLSHQLFNCMIIVNLLTSTVKSLTYMPYFHFLTQWLAHGNNS